MLNSIKCKLNCTKSRIINFIKTNKVQSIVAIAICILAILVAIFKIIADYDNISQINVVVLINCGEYSLFSFIFKLLILNALYCGLIVFGCMQIYLLMASYVGLFFVTYRYIKGYLFSLFSGGAIGVVSFLLYFVPLFLLVYVGYNVTIIKLADVTGVLSNGRRFVNFPFYKSTIFKTVLKSALINSICIIILSMLAFFLISIAN